jgi:hypothetical protein
MDVMRCLSEVPDTMSTALIAPASSRSGEADVLDVDTNEGLRAALGEVATHGWEGAAGRAVMRALTKRCAKWGANMAHRDWAGGETDPGDVLTLAWITLDRFARNVAAAEAPWAYLWTAVGRAMAVEGAAAAMLSARAVRRPRSEWPVGVNRLGADDERLGTRAGMDGTALAGRQELQSLAVKAIVRHLAGAEPADAEFWADAVDRALDVMAGARRSYEEVALRRDVYLTDVLGLSGAELAALAALLIGPRRGDRASQSLLLALHRDPSASPCDVVGAVDRIAFLAARRRAGTAALPSKAAA